MAIKRILIVGGGSAGWITASYLNAVLNRVQSHNISITLIESPTIGRIGVGEATIPTIRHVLQTVGIDETVFLNEADATFKQAIKFVNWLHKEDPGYYHPFDRRQAEPIDRAGAQWMDSDRSIPFAHTVSTQPHLCDLGLGPRMPDSKDFASPFPYAYHMDAEKFAEYLCKLATGTGVLHHQDDVTDVSVSDDGRIQAVTTKSGRHLEADLFIDCTGFASVLIEKTLRADFVDYSKWLLCDSAVAMRVPYEVHYPGHIHPYTTATALSSGWAWDIGLSNRRGLGYVYASGFLDQDSAEAELRRFEGPHAESLPARHLRFKVGRRATPWLSNCIAIGLSNGFIEPLESTGLYLTEFAAAMLCEHFPHTGYMEPLAKRFNQIMANRYEEILDFVNLHYCLTQRTDTEFWRTVQEEDRITDRLKDKLAFWKIKPPSTSDFDDHFRLFSYQSYEYVLYGMDFHRSSDKPQTSITVPDTVQRVVDAAKTRLPRHEAWLSSELGFKAPQSAPSQERS